MNSKSDNIVKVVGIIGTALSVGATLVTSWANDKKTEQVIEQKVQEAIKNLHK